MLASAGVTMTPLVTTAVTVVAPAPNPVTAHPEAVATAAAIAGSAAEHVHVVAPTGSPPKIKSDSSVVSA